ncbi:acyl-CoA-binding domain-containing protein 3-like isoform X2 [Hibiscus syriacus]|uniref:acyl-CoA-binding domain-containing protein 3-like isoform X2 n=1 Tax=Hibiscus syriacus TaxID=106335 RepID=UPI0019216F8F|nr:acyl-CoA-binding domain-containing protein 3-like isoform X2 [Hibiscus syriacus]
MGIVLELFMTAFIALVFSFFIAKIVSLATGVSGVDGKPLVDADDAIMMQGLKFADKLEVQGIASEKKVDFVQGSGDNKVDVFEPEQAGVGDRGFVECVEGSGERVVVDEFKAGEGEGVESSKLEGFESEKEVEFMQETAKIVDDLGAEKKIEYIGEGIEAENETKMQSEENQVKGIGEEEKGAKLENDDEDDDWEGVEKSELDKAFGAAAKFVEQKGDLGMGNDVQMQLYGLHKIATEGPCHEPQPLAFMASSRSKWNAWQRLGNMDPEAAMERYVTLLSDRFPGWMEYDFDGERNVESTDAGFPGSISADINSFPDKQAVFTHERNADLKSAPGGGDITESTSSEKQGKD